MIISYYNRGEKTQPVAKAAYAHQYKQIKSASERQWKKITTDVFKLLNNLPPVSESAGGHYNIYSLILTDGTGVPGTLPVVTDSEIILNGIMGKIDLSHESLWITKNKNRTTDADYCCTARKPYDLVVCGVLIVLQKHASGVWKISTNGTLEDWDPAREWVEKVLGYSGFKEVMQICGVDAHGSRSSAS